MIEVKNLYLNYIKEYSALYNINLFVDDNENIAILGNNESGKTSLLRCICGLENYTGEVYLNKLNLKKINFKNDLDVIYLSSNPVFFNNKSVYYNLAYSLKIREFPESIINQKINRALDLLQIDSLKERKIKELNNNEKLIVSIARSLTRDASIYLIDDIFNFDKITNEKIATILKENLNPNSSKIFAMDKEKDYLLNSLNISKYYFLSNGSIENNKAM